MSKILEIINCTNCPFLKYVNSTCNFCQGHIDYLCTYGKVYNLLSEEDIMGIPDCCELKDKGTVDANN